MERSRKQVAYLEGLREGLGVEPASREGKLLGAVLEAFRAVVEDMGRIAAGVERRDEYGPDLVRRLKALEDFLLIDHEDDAETEVLELECPACGGIFLMEDGEVQVGETVLDLVCPHCGQTLGGDRPAEDQREGRKSASEAGGPRRNSSDSPQPENGGRARIPRKARAER